MADQLTVPLVNGVRHSFASIELKLAGQIFVAFKSINYSRTRARGEVRGAHPDPIAKTRGENSYSADCELYLAEFMQFLRAVAGNDDISGYGDIAFDVTVTYSEDGFDVIVDEIIGCHVDTTEASNGQGTDPTVRKVDLGPLKIRYNRQDDLQNPLTPS
jgi:hypothetical protein